MIRSRLSYVGFYLRILTLLLPACAYFIALKLRFGFNVLFFRTPPLGLPSYWGVLLLTTIVWALAAEESGLWSVEQLYAPGKSRRLLAALAFTYSVVMAIGFLYREASYSRLVIAISATVLFILATVLQIVLRVFLEFLRDSGRNEVRILVVGTDGFARRVGTSLLHGVVLPCKVVGFVRLPDQEIAVDGPVYELDQIPSFSNGNSINDVIIALPAARLCDVERIAPKLEKLCVPTRVVIDLGEGVVLRDRLVGLGGIHMVDLLPTLAESRPNLYLFQKRIFDVAVSILILLATLPVTLLIAIAMKLGSP